MMTLWTGFKQQNSPSDETIGPNEEDYTLKHISKQLKLKLRKE